MFNRLLKTAAAAGLAFVMAAATAGAAEYVQPPQGYDADNTPSYYNTVPVAKPLWTANIGLEQGEDSYEHAGRVAAGDGRLYYVQSGKLTAADVHTGKSVWTVGSSIISPVMYDNGDVFALSGTGQLVKVNAASGKAVWTLKLSEITDESAYREAVLVYDRQNIYVSAGVLGVLAVDRSSGKLVWQEDTLNGASDMIATDDKLLVHTWESGAILVDVVYALEIGTGKQLWRLGSNDSPLVIDGDRLYSRNTWPPGEDTHQLQLNTVDSSTGETVDTYEYIPVPEGADQSLARAGKSETDGSSLFIQAADGAVYSYDYHQTGDVQQPEIYKNDGKWIAGPYNNKLFFEDADRQGITAVKLIDHRSVSYIGIDNPVDRLDFWNKGMFVGQTDGELYALNVTTGKASFRYETGASNFDPFVVEDGVLIARAEGVLYAFELPKELLAPLSDEAEPGVDYTRTDAKLSIDGKTAELKPDPIMINNSLYVPLRAIAEAVGAKVEYNNADKSVSIVYQGKTAAATGTRNINGTVYVQVRKFAELLGIPVEWDGTSRTVVVRTETA